MQTSAKRTGARDRDALLLPAGHLGALLADLRGVTFGERQNKVVRVGGFGGLDDLGA